MKPDPQLAKLFRRIGNDREALEIVVRLAELMAARKAK